MSRVNATAALFQYIGACASRAVLAVPLLVLLTLAGCGSRRAVCSLEVQGHVHALSTSGSVLVADFLDNKTCIWDWSDLRKPAQSLDKGRALTLGVLGSQCIFTELPAGPDRLQPDIVAMERRNRRPLRRWSFSANWYCSQFVSSANGRYMAVLLEENNPTGGDTCVGLIGPGIREVPWILTRGRIIKLAEDAMAVSNTGRYVALLGLGDMRAAAVVDTTQKRVVWRREMPRSRTAAFGADGRLLYIGGHYGVFALLADSGHMLSTWSPIDSKQLPAAVTRIAVSPDGRFLAAGTDAPDGKVYLLDAHTGRHVMYWTVAPKNTLIEGLAFSPSGTYLATADQHTGTIQIWDLPRATRTSRRR